MLFEVSFINLNFCFLVNVYPVFSSNPVLSILACLKSIKMYFYWQKKKKIIRSEAR